MRTKGIMVKRKPNSGDELEPASNSLIATAGSQVFVCNFIIYSIKSLLLLHESTWRNVAPFAPLHVAQACAVRCRNLFSFLPSFRLLSSL